jgi:hypothetical protein
MGTKVAINDCNMQKQASNLLTMEYGDNLVIESKESVASHLNASTATIAELNKEEHIVIKA